jgi:hypothetical protein
MRACVISHSRFLLPQSRSLPRARPKMWSSALIACSRGCRAMRLWSFSANRAPVGRSPLRATASKASASSGAMGSQALRRVPRSTVTRIAPTALCSTKAVGWCVPWRHAGSNRIGLSAIFCANVVSAAWAIGSRARFAVTQREATQRQPPASRGRGRLHVARVGGENLRAHAPRAEDGREVACVDRA